MKAFLSFCLLPFAICLLILCAHADPPSHPPAAVHAFNEGVKAFNAGQYQDAIASLDQAIENDGNFAEAYFARGACKHSLKKTDDALQDINQALQLNPDYYDACSLRGVIYYETQQWDYALADAIFVLDHRPNDAQSLLLRGVLYLKKQKVEPAARDFRLFLKLRPHDPLAPRMRKLLASLSRDNQTPAPSSEEENTAPEKPGEPAPRHAGATVSAATQQLGEELLLGSHQLSESYTRKVLRGERAEAVGNPEPSDAPAVVSPSGSSDQGVQIVEPK